MHSPFPAKMKSQPFIPGELWLRISLGILVWMFNPVARAGDPDPGQPLANQSAQSLPFVAGSVWVDVRHACSYLTDVNLGRLVRVPLGTLTPDREWVSVGNLVRLIPNADGSRLYLIRPGFNSGTVFVFDPESATVVRSFPIGQFPWDVVAVGQDRIVVAGGTAVQRLLAAYDTSNGTPLGSVVTGPATAAMARGDDRVLLFTDKATNKLIAQYQIKPDGTVSPEILSSGFIPFEARGPWTASPLGDGAVSATRHRLEVPADPTLSVIYRGKTEGSGSEEPDGNNSFDIASRHSAFHVSAITLDWVETRQWSIIQSTRFTNQLQDATPWNDKLVLTEAMPGSSRIRLLPNPALGMEFEVPPVAVAQRKSDPATTASAVVFSGETSSDAKYTMDQLVFRWDWEGDGAFDTAFTSNSVASHRFLTPGTYTVRMQVRNPSGATAAGSLSVTVTTAFDPGEPDLAAIPFQLPFAAAAVAFDGPGRRAYASDSNGKAVVGMDLESGLNLHRWTLPWKPERMATTPDLKRLYVVVATGVHGFPNVAQPGFLAEFDLEQGAMTRLIPLGLDAAFVAATDDGLLVVSDASDLSGPVRLLKASTGATTSFAAVGTGAGLRLGLDQGSVWASEPGTYVKLNILRPQLTIAAAFSVPGPMAFMGTLWPLPGNTLLNPAGQILSAIDGTHVLANQDANLGITEAAVLPGSQWLVAATPTGVRYLDLATLTWLAWTGDPKGPAWLGPVGTRHGVATIESGNTVIRLRSLPAIGTETNHPPVAAWAANLQTVVAVPGTVALSGSSFDDDGTVVAMELWNGDTKIADMDPKAPQTNFAVTESSTNELRLVVRDNLGAIGTSQVLRVIGDAYPLVKFLTPAVPRVAAGQPFDAEVEAIDPDGTIDRVEFWLQPADSLDRQLIGVAKHSPWRVVVPGISGDPRLLALAYDNLGIYAYAQIDELHGIGAEADDFYAAIVIPEAGGTDTRSNRNATSQKSEQNGVPGRLVGKTVWWQWTAPTNGLVTATTLGSSVETHLAAYTGDDLNHLLPGRNPDEGPGFAPASRVKFRTTPGTRYWFQADTTYPGGGDISVTVNFRPSPMIPTGSPPPPNDVVTNRLLVMDVPAVLTADSTGATMDAFEPKPYFDMGGRSVWWEWVAPTNGSLVVSTSGSSFDTVLGVYIAFPPYGAAFGTAGFNDDVSSDDGTSRVTVPTTPMTHYFIVVDGAAGEGGQVRLSLDFKTQKGAPAPINDNFADATEIPGDHFFGPVTTLGATAEAGEKLPVPNVVTNSIWMKWTAKHPAQVLMGSDVGLVFQRVWKGTSLMNLEPVAITSTLSPRSAFVAVTGTTYYFQLSTQRPFGFQWFLDATLPAFTDRFIDIAPLPEGGLGIRYTGSVGASGVLEKSEDLLQWSPVKSQVWFPGDRTALPVEAFDATFYRLRLDR